MRRETVVYDGALFLFTRSTLHSKNTIQERLLFSNFYEQAVQIEL